MTRKEINSRLTQLANLPLAEYEIKLRKLADEISATRTDKDSLTVAPAEPERELTPEDVAELQADFDAWKAGRDNRDAIPEAARKFLDKVDEVGRYVDAIIGVQTARGYPYTGPNWKQERDALAALLPAERAEKETK